MPDPIDAGALDRVKRLLQQDLKIDAIKVYRDATGATVDEAEQALAALAKTAYPEQPAAQGWLPRTCPTCGAPVDNRLLFWMMEDGKASCPTCGDAVRNWL